MGNLLRNGDFEADWSEEKSHWARVFPVGGVPYEAEIGNIFTPPGWTTWFVHKSNVWDQPEVTDAWKSLDPRRVHSGNKAVNFFTFYRKHDGGLFQKVSVVPGKEYTATVWCHAWSNHDNIEGGHPDDPFWSDGSLVGYGIVSLTPDQIPPLNGDGQNDANGNFSFSIGLDPEGGDNPFSSTVVWGEVRSNYNGYTVALPKATVVASGDTMTVWIRSKTLWKFKHNNFFCDDASLEGDDVPPAREYDRTYVLLPNNDPFDPAEQERISALNPGLTVGPSADDAGITHPYLKKRTVISYQPQTWGGEDALEKFWEEYYSLPDEIIYKEVASGYLLAQCDKEWAGDSFGGATCQSTICSEGCFITCLAMSQRFYGIDPNATPVTVDKALGPEGYVGCVSNWAGKPELYASTLQLRIEKTTDTATVDNHLESGKCAMAEVEGMEHFVLVIRKEDDRYWMLDPLKNVEGWLDEHYTTQSWRLVFKVKPPNPPDDKGRIGLHLQQEVGKWREMSSVTIPMKFLAGIQNIVTCKQLNPEGFPVWRQWVPNQGVYLSRPNVDGANAYLDTFRDSMEEVLERIATTIPGLPWPWFGVESLNEIYAHGDPSVITNSIPFDKAWIEVLKNYPEVSPCVYCAAVGNIEMPDANPTAWEALTDMAKSGENVTFSYHNYWIANKDESLLVSHWPWLAGRWTEFDEYLTSHGATVNWFFGETGGVGGWFDGSYHFLPNDGWKSQTCYGGNWPRYEKDLLTLNRMIQEWNTYHGNRAYGGTIFTTGGGTTWQTFEIGESEIDRLIEILG